MSTTKKVFGGILGILAVWLGVYIMTHQPTPAEEEAKKLMRFQKLTYLIERLDLQGGDTREWYYLWNRDHVALVEGCVVTEERWVVDNQHLATIGMAYSLRVISGAQKDVLSRSPHSFGSSAEAVVESGASFKSAIDLANLTPEQFQACVEQTYNWSIHPLYSEFCEEYKKLLAALEAQKPMGPVIDAGGGLYN